MKSNNNLLTTKNILFLLFLLYPAFAKADPQTDPNNTTQEDSTIKTYTKKWNFMAYIASNNNLNRFARLNVKEMEQIGSNKNINILVQIDKFGKKEVTRLFVEKNRSTIVETHANTPESISGTPESLFEFIKWGIKKYPATHHAILLWNHGSGIKDPNIWGKTSPEQRDKLFFFNPKTNLYELNKNLIRGIAFNDIFETYLTNQDLKQTLERISKELLGGSKIDILGMDACHMAMIEIGSQVKEAVKYMVSSQEIIPGPGWDYSKVLSPFKNKSLTPENFAQHMVRAYSMRYNNAFGDLTHSAINLTNQNQLEQNINIVSEIILAILGTSSKNIILNVISKVRKSPTATTSFMDEDYVDLYHFFESLQNHVQKLPQNISHKNLFEQLVSAIKSGKHLIKKSIVKNYAGSNIKTASGLSIYFPTNRIHNSYFYTVFAQKSAWSDFLLNFVRHHRSQTED